MLAPVLLAALIVQAPAGQRLVARDGDTIVYSGVTMHYEDLDGAWPLGERWEGRATLGVVTSVAQTFRSARRTRWQGLKACATETRKTLQAGELTSRSSA